MKKLLAVGVISFCITLAIVLGTRMSSEAMAVVVGVVCGVAASIPMSAIILLIIGRRTQAAEPNWQQNRAAYPPVVVIQGGTAMRQVSSPNFSELPVTQETPRQFRIIGEEWATAKEQSDATTWSRR